MLRANGAWHEIVEDFPFVLSLSKHEIDFLSSLLAGRVSSRSLQPCAVTQHSSWWGGRRRVSFPATHRPWTEEFLAAPSILGVVDSYGIELLHPMREGRSAQPIGRKGKSN